jgi:broad specificity phosphatase PhoE
MKKLYLVRHAESVGNIGTVQQGPTTPLSEKGAEQTTLIAERFRTIKIDSILSSPQTRAKVTAEAIAAATGKNIRYSDLLVERKKPTAIIGLDRTSPEFDKIEDAVRNNFHNLAWRHSDEENFLDLKTRAATILNHAESLDGENIVMVSHGVFMVMLFAYVLFGESLTSQEFWAIFVGTDHKNTGITVLQQSKFKDEPVLWKLITWNDHAHLG